MKGTNMLIQNFFYKKIINPQSMIQTSLNHTFKDLINMYSCKNIYNTKTQIQYIKQSNGDSYRGYTINTIPYGLGTRYTKFNYQFSSCRQFEKKLGAIQIKYVDYYEGEFVNGRIQGKGFWFVQRDMKAYQGIWKNGSLLYKQVTIYDAQYPKDDITFYKTYEGGYANSKKQGKGTQYYKNGNKKYEGYFVQNERQGQGTQYYLNKKIKYTGNWHLGLYSGTGVQHYEDDLYYEGSFSQGKRSGYGRMFRIDGNLVFDGYWLNGCAHGQGIQYYKSGGKVYEGSWQRNQRNGKCIQYYEDGKIYYTGEWKNNQIDGKGILYYKNGSMSYSGQFTQNKRSGQGTQYYESGKIKYHGGWKLDAPQGQGTKYYEDGTINYQGQWCQDKRHGYGILYYPNKIICYIGEWKDDKQEGRGVRCILNTNQIYEIYYEEKVNGQHQINPKKVTCQSKDVEQVNKKINELFSLQKGKFRGLEKIGYKLLK